MNEVDQADQKLDAGITAPPSTPMKGDDMIKEIRILQERLVEQEARFKKQLSKQQHEIESLWRVVARKHMISREQHRRRRGHSSPRQWQPPLGITEDNCNEIDWEPLCSDRCNAFPVVSCVAVTFVCCFLAFAFLIRE